MAYLNTSIPAFTSPLKLVTDGVFQLRFGRRQLSIQKDFRKRFYQTNPIVECYAGADAGHLEVLVFRAWLIVFCKAEN
jgi:hypothetical protein